MTTEAGDPLSRPFIYFESEMSLYEPFMKNPGGKLLLDAAQGTRLAVATGDLAKAWRGTHYDRGMPWLLARAAVDSAHAASNHRPGPFPWTAALRGIAGRMGGTRLRVRDKREVARIAKSIADEVDAEVARQRSEPASDADYLRAWDDYLKSKEFKIALEASERSAFLSLYFAYENFVASTVELLDGTWPRSTSAIGDRFKAGLGENAHRDYWDSPPVAAARHVRDAFAHRAGRPNDRTAQHSNHVQVREGWIVLGASDTNRLYDDLHACVLGVIATFVRVTSSASATSNVNS